MVYDRRTRVRPWQIASERAGAVDGVLGVGGAARLLDASCVSSRNTELLNGESCLHAAFNGQRAAAVRIDHRRSRGAAWAGARTPGSFARRTVDS